MIEEKIEQLEKQIKIKMKRYLFLLLVCFLSLSINAQINIKPYEQIALNYFAENIAKQEYPEIKYFLFDGNLETTSPLSYSFCMPLSKKDNFKLPKISKINIPNNKLISRKIGFFKKIFTSKKKISNIYVFRHYPKNEDIVVVLNLSKKTGDDFFSFLIDSKTKKVLDYCKKIYYE